MKKLIQEIQSLLQHGNPPDALVEEVAAEFAQAVEQVNGRLQEVISLLVNGYRDEALELAEHKPELTKLVSMLDFPQRQDWSDLLTNRLLGLPPTINISASEAIEEAYELRLRLQPIMKAHRKLALSQAPLRPRIDVLKKLASSDPTNPLWPADLETYETTRLNQIKQELSSARRDHDLNTIQQLAAEIQNNTWAVKVPSALKKDVEAYAQDFARSKAETDLIQLTEQLNQAWGAFDREQGVQLARQWRTLNETARMSSGNETFDTAQDALGWADEVAQELDDELGFQKAIHSLEFGVEDGVPLGDLERLLYAAQSYERELPAVLERRVQEYHASLQAAGRRKRMAIVAGSVTVISVLVAGTVWFLIAQGRQRELAEAREQLAGLQGAEQYPAAEQFMSGAKPYVKADGKVLEEFERIKKEHDTEVSRVTEFQNLKDKISFDQRLDGKIEKDLRQLEQLAKLESEKREVELLQGQLQNERLVRQRQRNDTFQKSLDSFISRLSGLPANQDESNFDKLQGLDQDLELFSKSQQGTVDGLTKVTPSLIDQIGVVRKQIANRVEVVQRDRTARERLASFSRELPDVDAFSKRLVDFANEFPTNRLSGVLRQSAAERTNHLAFAAWQRLARDTAWQDLKSATPERRAELLKQLDECKARLNLVDVEQSVARSRIALDQLLKQDSAKLQTALDEFRTFFDREDFNSQHLALVKKKDEVKWYYLKSPAELMESKSGAIPMVKITFFEDMTKAKTKTEYPDVDAVQKRGLAGQCKIKEMLVQKAGELKNASCDRTLLEMLKIASAETESDGGVPTDPIVQGLIIEHVLELCVNHGVELKKIGEKWTNSFAGSRIKAIDWMDLQNHAILSETREKIRSLVSGLHAETGGLEVTISSFEQQWSTRPDWTQAFEYEICGWLNQQGNLMVFQPNDPGADDLELYALLPIEGGKSFRIKRVAKYQAGTLTEVSDPRELQTGRIVYARKGK